MEKLAEYPLMEELKQLFKNFDWSQIEIRGSSSIIKGAPAYIEDSTGGNYIIEIAYISNSLIPCPACGFRAHHGFVKVKDSQILFFFCALSDCGKILKYNLDELSIKLKKDIANDKK